jgi:hypothetical protein
MTKSIHFIGDSHIIPIYAVMLTLGFKRIQNEYTYEAYPEEVYRGAYDSKNDILYNFHSKPGRLAYNVDYSNLEFSQFIKAGDKIVACAGECDIRLYLHRYNNTQEVVKAYIDKTVSHFAENEVFFLTPVPQHGHLYSVTLNEVNYTFDSESRIREHNIFISTLNEISSQLDLPEPIDITFGSDILGHDHREEDFVHVNIKHSKKIVDVILNRQDLHR